MKTYSLQLRIWHWLHAVAVLGLLGTFFLRKTFLSWRDNSAIIASKLGEFDIAVTADQAAAIAKAVRAPMWEWHIIFGYLFAVLVLWRVVMILREGFGHTDESAHMKMVYLSYKVLYVVLAFMAVSGLLINAYEALGMTKEFAHDIKEVHETLAWVVAVFVPMHIAGVFVADNRDQKGIVSKMISG